MTKDWQAPLDNKDWTVCLAKRVTKDSPVWMDLLVCLEMPPRKDKRVNPVHPDSAAIQVRPERPVGQERRVCPVWLFTVVLVRQARRVTRDAVESMDEMELTARRVNKVCRAFGASLARRDLSAHLVFLVLPEWMVCPALLVLLVLLAILVIAVTRESLVYLVCPDSRVRLDPLDCRASPVLLALRVSAVFVVSPVFRPPFPTSVVIRDPRASAATLARRASKANEA